MYGAKQHAARTQNGRWHVTAIEPNHVADGRVDANRWGRQNELRDAPPITDLAFCGKAQHRPRGPAADEVVHLGETQLIEPTRGTGAEVSMLIEAVDDERPRAIQTSDTVCRHSFQRRRHSTREMLLGEDRFGQHIDELSAALHQSLGTVNINSLRHCPPVPTDPSCETHDDHPEGPRMQQLTVVWVRLASDW